MTVSVPRALRVMALDIVTKLALLNANMVSAQDTLTISAAVISAGLERIAASTVDVTIIAPVSKALTFVMPVNIIQLENFARHVRLGHLEMQHLQSVAHHVNAMVMLISVNNPVIQKLEIVSAHTLRWARTVSIVRRVFMGIHEMADLVAFRARGRN